MRRGTPEAGSRGLPEGWSASPTPARSRRAWEPGDEEALRKAFVAQRRMLTRRVGRRDVFNSEWSQVAKLCRGPRSPRAKRATPGSHRRAWRPLFALPRKAYSDRVRSLGARLPLPKAPGRQVLGDDRTGGYNIL